MLSVEMADVLEGRRGEQRGATLPGMLTSLLDPAWRLRLTSEEPGRRVGKSGSLPDSSQLLNCILKTSAGTSKCSPALAIVKLHGELGCLCIGS